MLFSAATTLLCALAPLALAQNPLTEYTLKAANITAKVIPRGATLTSLLVPDRNGNVQDVILGYDNTSQYPIDSATNHTFFGTVVGRFANRIKNGTFTIDGITSQIPENENGGKDTLHGGSVGYDQRNWTVTSYSNNSITLSLMDDGLEGFPGAVLTHATFTLTSETLGSPWGIPHPRLTTNLVTVALNSKTPIMLANHFYWNLNGFSAPTILNDTTLYMPYSDRYIQTDTILIPNGTIGAVSSFPVLDFTTPKLLGTAISDPSANGSCGAGCTGIDNAFIIDRPLTTGSQASNFPLLSLWSQNTGIRLDVGTNQQGLQIYSCNGQNGTIPVKPSQVARNKAAGVANATSVVNKYGCLVIETQAYIDGINNPQFGADGFEIFSPSTQVAENFATYDFSTF